MSRTETVISERAGRLAAIPEPTAADLDDVVQALKRAWTATLTVRRRDPLDVGYREVFVLLDGQPLTMLRYGAEFSEAIEPGRHTLKVHNTLFRKSLDFVAGAGERITFSTANRAGWGTYSPLALLIGFLGAGPFYLSLEREDAPVTQAHAWTANS